MAEFTKYEGSEGALRSKNKECDKIRADEIGGYVARFGPSGYGHFGNTPWSYPLEYLTRTLEYPSYPLE